jgi:hypothetical protein
MSTGHLPNPSDKEYDLVKKIVLNTAAAVENGGGGGGGGGGGAGVASVNTRTGAVVLTKTDVGLASVNDTSDANKPISTATQTALDLKANAASTQKIITSGTLAPSGGIDGDIYLQYV